MMSGVAFALSGCMILIYLCWSLMGCSEWQHYVLCAKPYNDSRFQICIVCKLTRNTPPCFASSLTGGFSSVSVCPADWMASQNAPDLYGQQLSVWRSSHSAHTFCSRHGLSVIVVQLCSKVAITNAAQCVPAGRPSPIGNVMAALYIISVLWWTRGCRPSTGPGFLQTPPRSLSDFI